MNSQVINKVIRSEVWPALRRQGFSSFDNRNVWRYRGPFVDVVKFQSFSAYLADGLGCTSFSFALNLGVFLRHSTLIWPTRSDSEGLPRPSESECPFRAHLKKRSTVDGFGRADIFFVDEEGRTTAAVFRETIAPPGRTGSSLVPSLYQPRRRRAGLGRSRRLWGCPGNARLGLRPCELVGRQELVRDC